MMHSKKLMLGICLVLLIILIVGYVIMTKINSRSAQIKDTFNQTLKLYPTKILKTFMIRKAFEIKSLKRATKAIGLLILRW